MSLLLNMNKNIVKFVFLDVDGTLTDGKIYIGNDGEAFKAFCIKDGYGLNDICKKNKITPVIVTGRESKITEIRCKELNITEIHQGEKNKLEFLKKFIYKRSISIEECSYIGDDLNDFECMEYINEGNGLTGAPADAVDKIIEIAKYKCEKNGGCGAVREFIEQIVKYNKQNSEK